MQRLGFRVHSKGCLKKFANRNRNVSFMYFLPEFFISRTMVREFCYIAAQAAA